MKWYFKEASGVRQCMSRQVKLWFY